MQLQRLNKYLIANSKTDPFCKDILSVNLSTLSSKHQLLKLQSKKLKSQIQKLILDNIEEILEGQLKQMEIRSEMNEIAKESPENMLKTLEEVTRENNKQTNAQVKVFPSEKASEIVNLFQTPQILRILKNMDPEEYKKSIAKLKEALKQYPKLSKALLPCLQQEITQQEFEQLHLEYKHYIRCKNTLDQGDAHLLTGPFASLVAAKLQQNQQKQAVFDQWIKKSDEIKKATD